MRTLSGEAWARMQSGDPRAAIDLLITARSLAEGPQFSDVDRADVLFRLGVCRYKLSSVATATALLDEALALAERSGLPSDLLRAEILGWRSRCRRRQRDLEAAREDVELRARARAGARGPPRDREHVLPGVARLRAHGSLAALAELRRAGTGALPGARGRAERGQAADEPRRPQPDARQPATQAIEHLKASFAVALEVDSTEDAAQAAGSLATVHLHLGDFDAADSHARHALELLDGREDYLHEIGPSQLVLGRAMLERERLDEAEQWFRAAEMTYEQMSSISHRASAWVALGDLASRRGDLQRLRAIYRNAAEALQDVRF